MLKRFLLCVPLLVQAVAAAPGSYPHHRHLRHHAHHNFTRHANIVPRDDEALPEFIKPKAPFVAELPDDFDKNDGWSADADDNVGATSKEEEQNTLNTRQAGKKNVLYFANW